MAVNLTSGDISFRNQFLPCLKTQASLTRSRERKAPDGSKFQVQNLKTAEATIEHLTKLAEIGIDQVIFNMQNPINEHNPLDIFKSDIIPAVKGL